MITNFYKNNNLILTQKEIKILENHFKDELNKHDCWEAFSFPVLDILNKSIPITNYYKNQYKNNIGLQSGKLLEIVVGETLSVIFGTNYTSNNNFENEKYLITLIGDEGKNSGKSGDIIIFDKEFNHKYIGEIKDQIARPGDCDLKYDEEGHLYPSPNSRNWNEEWRPIVDSFNANNSIFNLFGHNYSISEHKEICENITHNYFSGVDFLFTCKEDYLVTIPTNNFNMISSIFSFQGSEIRSTGKNTVKPFTEKYMKNTILNSEYFIEETSDTYRMKINVFPSLNNKGRNGGTSSKYTFIPGFKVEKDKVTFNENGECIIIKSGIKQINPNISVHITINESYENIKKIFKED